ncbi:MAG TPA: outer membrane lipoprotein-sorting protein [Verrucomicrobiales bacterium]|nr:outer membrane lipoprotein-sorting protein [Verrucomicrobiales bacterium]
MKIAFCSLSLFFFGATFLPAQDVALLEAEQARGILTGNQGVQWTVEVSGTKNAKFVATSQGGKIFAEVFEPDDAKGRRYLAESDGDMWFWKPGLSRPVSVSKRQRLSGDAAIGDIASTSFVDGYKVEKQEAGDVNGEAATVYTMKSNSPGDTYAMIKYWVTTKGNLGKKAEFYAKSANLIRSSSMDYKNTANGRPFLSQMKIDDSGTTITLKFSEVKIGSFPSDLFARDNLGGPKSTGPKR